MVVAVERHILACNGRNVIAGRRVRISEQPAPNDLERLETARRAPVKRMSAPPTVRSSQPVERNRHSHKEICARSQEEPSKRGGFSKGGGVSLGRR